MTVTEGTGSGCGEQGVGLKYMWGFSPHDLLIMGCQSEEKDGSKDDLPACSASGKYECDDAIHREGKLGARTSSGI